MLIIQFFFLHGLCSFNKSKSCYANKLYGIGFPNIGLLKSVLLGKKNVLIRDGGKKEKKRNRKAAYWANASMQPFCSFFTLTMEFGNFQSEKYVLTHLFRMHPFLTPWKPYVFWCFQGVKKGCIENKWVKDIHRENTPSCETQALRKSSGYG